MSGTSLDGVDVVIARLEGHGRGLKIANWYGATYSFSEALRHCLKRVASQESFGIAELSQLNVRLAHEYAQAVKRTLEDQGERIDTLDLIGSHGQTIRHLPDPMAVAGQAVSSTLQIGDPSTMAQLLGIPVIGDFRLADMARGGQGAPLVPYFDYVIFTHKSEARGCLNLGGVANLTVLPADANLEDVCGFDTGPGNMMMDALCRTLLNLPYDDQGRITRSGTVNEPLLRELLQDPYFFVTPPKSTGREYLSQAFLERLFASSNQMSSADLIATATALTAESIWHAYETFIRPTHVLDRLILSGGGAHNQALLDFLRECFSRDEKKLLIETSDAYGIDVDSKEALCFAVLAHETASAVPTSIPSVTGADRPAVLGKLCIP